MKIVLLIVGIVLVLIGLLWVGQGLGYVPWPRSSFMIGEMVWAYYGAGLAVAGVALILLSRR